MPKANEKHETNSTSFSQDVNMAQAPSENFVGSMNYHQSYRRALKSFRSACVGIVLSNPTAGLIVQAQYMINNAGYWGLTWGWFIASVLLLLQPLAIAELVSSMPVNGAFYWYTAALAPPRFSRPLSFVVGWLNTYQLITTVASAAYACGLTLANICQIRAPSWNITSAEVFGMAVGVILLWTCLNFLRFERLTFVVMCIAALIGALTLSLVIGLPTSHAALGLPFAKASTAFGEFHNFSEWEVPVAAQMSFFAVPWVCSGWQGPCWVVEGTRDPRRTAPRAVVSSYIVMCSFGLAICWVLAFCITDMTETATNGGQYPIIGLISAHWTDKGAFAFLLMMILTIIIGGSSQILVGACAIAAFARDGGVPFSKTLGHVRKEESMPVPAALVLATGGSVLLLFSFSTVAATIIYSLAVIAANILLVVPIATRIFAGDRFKPGPWSYGRWSIPVHAAALCVTLWLIILECFPSSPFITAATFNYNWVVTIGSILTIIALFFWIGDGYTGPKLNFHDGPNDIVPFEEEVIDAAEIEKG